MEGDFIKIYRSMLPLSFLYGMGVEIRNKMYEWGILSSRSFDVPVISIGNLTVGGSGKTPHIEYLIRLLQDKFKVAVLSRGYKRKSRGYLLADGETPIERIGDEPYQIKQKFPHVYMAVDKNRCNAIGRLCNDKETADTEVVLLDDAYQYRKIIPGINILLVDYHRMICYDRLLPAGRLREREKEKVRANIIVITKCPHDIKPMDYRVITKIMNPYPFQHLYFSTLKYGSLVPLSADLPKRNIESLGNEEHILLVTGIASPEQIILDLKKYTRDIHPMSFGDHHYFSDNEIDQIHAQFKQLPGERKLILITEKDAARLSSRQNWDPELKRHIYILPVEIEFLLEKEELFNQQIISYVRKNSRNSILAKGKDAHKS